MQALSFEINASGVPANYRSSIIHICMLYPHRLMFVCQVRACCCAQNCHRMMHRLCECSKVC